LLDVFHLISTHLLEKFMKIKDLRCEYRINPLGIDVLKPHFSWRLDSDQRGARQRAYRIVAAPDVESLQQAGSLLWDSGKVDTDHTIQITYDGSELQSRQRVYWRVRVWDENDLPAEWSPPAWFEMGLLSQGDWQAEWIGNALVGGPRTSVPSPIFRKAFSINQKIISARLYITSLGIYEAYINGRRVGEDVFTPGWTDYDKRVQYQTYDITEVLTRGENVIGVLLGDGWYCGYVAWEGRQQYGDRPKLFAQLEIVQSDGTTQTLVTDKTWRTAISPILESDLLMGEAYDARLEIPKWNLPSPADKIAEYKDPWTPALTFAWPTGLAIVAQNTPTVRVDREITPISEPGNLPGWPVHHWIFDFGQNLVGRVRLKIQGTRGTTITMQFGETLDDRGHLYTENLRAARQTETYTLKGDPESEIYESSFTFHGFRYVLVSGLEKPPGLETLTAIVLTSENQPALVFECSNSLLNQLQHNIEWGWKGNSIDVPTDCPQRDERLGWTGDAQVFVKTAVYISDAAGFFTKWIQDLSDSQIDYGAIPSVAPCISSLENYDGGAAWSDAFIIVPWTIWQQYGDTRLLETHYEAMCRYMDYLVTNSPGLIRLLPDENELEKENNDGKIGGNGDWLAQDGSTERQGLTPKSLIGTAFLAYDARLMSQIAAALNKTSDARRYTQLYEDTRKAFIQRFVTPDGLMAGQTQTSYVLALYFDLVPKSLRPVIINSLVEDIENRKIHLSTGFVGTPYICQVLTDAGHLDLAYSLLLQEDFPSWLYPVRHGATTIWERWDGWTEENGFQDPGMNSFNHYAYGAIGTWMYENITGIRSDPTSPGFKHFFLHPHMGGGLTFARGEYRSIYGTIRSHWWIDGNRLIWEVTVPHNTTATVSIPSERQDQIFDGTTPIEESLGVEFIRTMPEFTTYNLQPGTYTFIVKKRKKHN
jgi:alpha-L-rhamnosidase